MPETTHGLEAVSLDEEILVLSPSDEFDLGEESPRNEKENRDTDADDEADVDVEEDGEEEGGHPDEGLGGRPPCETDKVPELNEDAQEGHHDDGGQNSLEQLNQSLRLQFLMVKTSGINQGW